MSTPHSHPALPRNVFGGIPLDGPPLLTPEQAATYIGHDRSTIYDMVDTGELEALRRPKKDKAHIRITRRSLVVNRAVSSNRTTDETLAVLIYAIGTLSETQRSTFLARLEKGARA